VMPATSSTAAFFILYAAVLLVAGITQVAAGAVAGSAQSTAVATIKGTRNLFRWKKPPTSP